MPIAWDLSPSVLLIHLLLYPLYQILGTIRHEGLGHALAASIAGLKVTEIVVYPHRHEGRWCFGWVQYRFTPEVPTQDAIPKYVSIAPYIVVLLYTVLGIILALTVEFRMHAFLAIQINLVLSPVLDTLYNLLKYKLKGTGDFARYFEPRPLKGGGEEGGHAV